MEFRGVFGALVFLSLIPSFTSAQDNALETTLKGIGKAIAAQYCKDDLKVKMADFVVQQCTQPAATTSPAAAPGSAAVAAPPPVKTAGFFLKNSDDESLQLQCKKANENYVISLTSGDENADPEIVIDVDQHGKIQELSRGDLKATEADCLALANPSSRTTASSGTASSVAAVSMSSQELCFDYFPSKKFDALRKGEKCQSPTPAAAAPSSGSAAE